MSDSALIFNILVEPESESSLEFTFSSIMNLGNDLTFQFSKPMKKVTHLLVKIAQLMETKINIAFLPVLKSISFFNLRTALPYLTA